MGIRYLVVILLFFPEIGLLSNSHRSTNVDSIDSTGSLSRDRNGVKIRHTLDEQDLSKTFIPQSEATDEVEKVAKFLADQVEDYFSMGDRLSEEYDRQFIFYILKVSDWMTYKADARVTMMGEIVTDFSLLEKMRFSQHSKKIFESIEFWSTYYRQNNYFYEMNEGLLS